MAGRGKAHSLKGTKTRFRGIPISGYSDDGTISIEPVNDAGEITEGADGEEAVFSFSHGSSYIATIQLMETARSVYFLDLLYDEQKLVAQGGPMPQYPFSFWNPKTGERVATDFAFFQVEPSRGAAKRVGVREYKIALLNAKRTPPTLNLV